MKNKGDYEMKHKTMYVTTFLAVAILLLIISVPGCQSQAGETDTRIETSANSSYVFKTYLKGDSIKVQSKDGDVTMTGTVTNDSHKSMAEETVSSLPGVKSVNNMLHVSSAPPAAFSDAWVAERVKGALMFHRSVSFIDTDVSVENGNVILKGKASSEAQKQLTTEYAKDVSGVKSVDNQMIVTKEPTTVSKTVDEVVTYIDDASITTQVKMSLLYHHGTDVYDTEVSTNKGVVTLAGTAKNQAEIDLATKFVNDIHGVKSVSNNMSIETTQSSTE